MTTADIIQTIAIVVSLLATLAAAGVAALLSVRLARRERADAKRQFCFELQRQFDSPEMFRCRFHAWKMLDRGEFDSIQTVEELFTGEKWTFEVSAIIHFFESLGRYCDEDLVDERLACQLFARTYAMWYDRLLHRLTVNERSQQYAGWVTSIQRLNTRIRAGA